MATSPAPSVLLFDVNETLLDVAALRPGIAAAVGGKDVMGEWFARLLHGSLVANHLGRYRPFGEIAVEALQAVAARHGVDLDPTAAVDVVAGMVSLPAHPDVAPALDRLRRAGLRMAALSNGSTDTVVAQLDTAGLAVFFEQAISVDQVRRFKPAPEVYLTAAVRLDVEVDRAMMVASHDWDVLGAQSIGMRGAFLARPGARWGPVDRSPDLSAPDLVALADLVLAGT
jgi:2-haloacid dehalogenase